MARDAVAFLFLLVLQMCGQRPQLLAGTLEGLFGLLGSLLYRLALANIAEQPAQTYHLSLGIMDCRRCDRSM
jgi:hypothetical protein